MNIFADPLNTVILNPGDYHFGGGHTRIATLLGSCVSITVWHPFRRIGGMCHYMLAERRVSRKRSVQNELDGRYAEDAMALLIQHIVAAGSHPSEYQAKLFGGGNMLNIERHGEAMHVGSRNIARARELLAANKFSLVAEHVGGNGHRKLYLDLHSGHVWLAFPEGSNAYIRNPHE